MGQRSLSWLRYTYASLHFGKPRTADAKIGNLSQPNIFSYNLLNSIGNITGSNPVIRVGGNTQDYALYDPNLQVATNGTFTPASAVYPTILSIGNPYYQSFQTWPGINFTYGLNLAKNGSTGYNNLLATVPLACEALRDGRLAHWELGNEPDLYKTSSQGQVRPWNWTEQDYVSEWLSKAAIVWQLVGEHCPQEFYSYMAPSFAGVTNSLNPITTWHDGLDTCEDIAIMSSHNYIGGATEPGITLQGTLMNHSSTIVSIAPQLAEAAALSNYSIPFVLGETNSLYNGGAPGLSNTFGAALWGLDFNLWCASQGIRRTHMHQGTNFHYASWQPIPTAEATLGTKAPYYGNIAVAYMLGNLVQYPDTQIANLPLEDETEAAYAAYVGGRLARLAVVNMVEYNCSVSSTPGPPRPEKEYSFVVSLGEGEGTGLKRVVGVQRLMANGSDAISGITFNGYSYNYELDAGKPVRLTNVTVGETVSLGPGGIVNVLLPYSSAAILNFEWW